MHSCEDLCFRHHKFEVVPYMPNFKTGIKNVCQVLTVCPSWVMCDAAGLAHCKGTAKHVCFLAMHARGRKLCMLGLKQSYLIQLFVCIGCTVSPPLTCHCTGML